MTQVGAQWPAELQQEFTRRLEQAFAVRTVPDPPVDGARVTVDVSPEVHPLLLTEDTDTGIVSWVAPDRVRSGPLPGGRVSFTMPGGPTRGVVGTVARKVLRVVIPAAADRLVGLAANALVRSWETDHRPSLLRRFDLETADLPASGAVPDGARLSGGPVLLLLHDLASTTAAGFAGLRGLGLSVLDDRYDGRIIAFDHPTFSVDPHENAAALVAALDDLARSVAPAGGFGPLDVLGHGRGGLVARSLATRLDGTDGRVQLRNVVAVGTPFAGTPLASSERIGALLDRLTNLLVWVPLGGVGDLIDGVLALAQHVAGAAVSGVPGITALAPKSPFLEELAAAAVPPTTRWFAVSSDYEPPTGSSMAGRARDLLADHVLGGANDLLVPVASVVGVDDAHRFVPAEHHLAFGRRDGVTHASFFEHPATVDLVLAASDSGGQRGADGEAIVLPDLATAPESSDLQITVTHGSFENSRYALMVGSFEGEALSGAERFLDRQLDGRLTSWNEVDRYPAALGTSIFIGTTDDSRPTRPPGAHIVGLGPTVELGRNELAFAVRQALVDRCLRLYCEPGSPGERTAGGEADPEERILVGVSSILLGVRHDDAMRIEDSVAGIVEGVLAANRLLARYESTRPDPGRPVRIAALELIERYADRADLAASAVRSLSTAVRLDGDYGFLRDVTVQRVEGALPAGAALVESSQTWRRFLITGAMSDGAGAADAEGRTMRFDVSLLGGDARAERVRHRLDRPMVDALVNRLATSPGDRRTARTLRDQLVPSALRSQFLTTSAIQFIVDADTANYPWELLTAPESADARALEGTGAVLRQFSESEHRRTNPDRASNGRALVVAAGRVPGQSELAGVHPEADGVAEILRSVLDGVELLDDRDQEIDLVDLSTALFDDHQILHIASHGVFQEGHPEATGAILSSAGMLTVDTVAQLPHVPDVVFLNCCSLGRIGQHRLAAGLAREFMGLGARAVVAAGWPVGDRAAAEFAATFYRCLADGRSFGDAVARARIACAAVGGGQTWAAYQCYGDPAFVLQHNRQSVDLWSAHPVSGSDLVSRLEALDVRISDLGRPGRSQGSRRDKLLAERAELAAWADAHPQYAGGDAVRRLLAKTARELGEFDEAARRYLTFVRFTERDGTAEVGLGAGTSTLRDLQQAANCLARGAQQIARELGDDDSGRSAAVAQLRRAIAIADTSVTLCPDNESYGVLAGAYKKLATVDRERRDEWVLAALGAYEHVTVGADGYGVQNALQMAALDGGERGAALAARLREAVIAVGSTAAVPIRGRRLVDESVVPDGNFWSRAAAGDDALTALMTAATDDERRQAVGQVIDAYEAAFRSRSTWSERRSSLDHLADLRDLLTPTDPRRPHLRRALVELQRWQAFSVAETEEATAETGTDTDPTRRRAAGVTLTAYPAARGDCLAVEYTADTGDRHVLLVDGGLKSTYADGLQGFLRGADGRPRAVDTVVVTHVDADHIEGVLEGFVRSEMAAGDVWFNGLAEIQGALRGPKQGDALSARLTGVRRNGPTGGEAIVVPETGPLPVFALPGGASCVLLSPTLAQLERLQRKWVGGVRGTEPTLEELFDLLGDDTDDETERGGAKAFGRDPSAANGSSIAVLFEHRGASLLLTGDAHAAVLHASIVRLLRSRRRRRLAVDVFKLPHHGSANNLSDALLEVVDPRRILVCTDGSRFGHPDELALGLLRRHYPHVPILFTDDNEHLRNRAATCDGVVPVDRPVVISL